MFERFGKGLGKSRREKIYIIMYNNVWLKKKNYQKKNDWVDWEEPTKFGLNEISFLDSQNGGPKTNQTKFLFLL